jgi:hypothetical protein
MCSSALLPDRGPEAEDPGDGNPDATPDGCLEDQARGIELPDSLPGVAHSRAMASSERGIPRVIE